VKYSYKLCSRRRAGDAEMVLSSMRSLGLQPTPQTYAVFMRVYEECSDFDRMQVLL
jgi:pentatricopeptide repeat protein